MALGQSYGNRAPMLYDEEILKEHTNYEPDTNFLYWVFTCANGQVRSDTHMHICEHVNCTCYKALAA